MDQGGEAARPTTVRSADLRMAGAIQVQGDEAHMSTGTFHGQRSPEPSAAAYHNAAEFARHVRATAGRGEVPGVVYPNIGEFWRQLGLVDVALLGPHLADGIVQVLDNYGYAALQPRPGAGRGVVLVGPQLPGGGGGAAVYNWDYTLQPRPGAGRGEVPVDLLPDGAGHGETFVGRLRGGGVPAYDDYVYYALQPRSGPEHGEALIDHLIVDGAGQGEVFVGLLPGGVDTGYNNYGYYALLPRPGAGHGEVLLDPLPDGAGHGEVFVGLLPGGVGAAHAHDDYGFYPLQRRPGVGQGVVLVDLLPDGARDGEAFVGLLPGGVAHDDYGHYAWQPRPGAGRGEVLPDGIGVVFDGSGADRIAGALRGPNPGYDNRGVVAEHLRRLLPFAGIGASYLAINELTAGPGSPAVAFHLFALLLGGLFLVILHVLRV